MNKRQYKKEKKKQFKVFHMNKNQRAKFWNKESIDFNYKPIILPNGFYDDEELKEQLNSAFNLNEEEDE